MDTTQRADLREAMAVRLIAVREELVGLLELWDADLPGDFLARREYPFDRDLEEQIAAVTSAVEAIRAGNEWLRMRPLELKVSRAEYEHLLALLEEPARPLPRLAAMLREQSPFTD